MVPSATLLAADVLPAWPPRVDQGQGWMPRPDPSPRLPELITASGLRVRRVEPIRSVAMVAEATLIAAEKAALTRRIVLR